MCLFIRHLRGGLGAPANWAPPVMVGARTPAEGRHMSYHRFSPCRTRRHHIAGPRHALLLAALVALVFFAVVALPYFLSPERGPTLRAQTRLAAAAHRRRRGRAVTGPVQLWLASRTTG